ncbi:hypothetical protein ScPMuIL_018731, partial [Solemya velum]
NSFYNIRKKGERVFASNHVREITFEIRINNNEGRLLSSFIEELHRMFTSVLQTVRGSLAGNDSARVVIHHQALNNPICGLYEHRPNFVVAHTVCPKCIEKPLTPKAICHKCGSRCDVCADNEDEPPCKSTCGRREIVFSGNNTCETFCKWLFNPRYRYFKAVAHNMRSYDGFFLLNYLINQSIRPNKIIFSGSKIMYMEVGRDLHIRVLDSLNFLPMKLSQLPISFGLAEVKKGWFPHFFNTRENQEYIGPYPSSHYYGVDYMGAKEREAFLDWHGGLQGQIFDFRREILEYWDLTKRKVAAKEFVSSSIAKVPSVKNTDNFSKISIQWLQWRSKKEGVVIQHALNVGEKKLPGTRYKLDGYCAETNTAYEYHGCVFHTCPTCFPTNRDQTFHPLTRQSMNELYALTLKKKSYIKSLGM